MTLQAAMDTAQAAAVRDGKPYLVYRWPNWPTDCWGCVAEDRGLAPTADIRARVDPSGRLSASTSEAADSAQGGLW